MSLSMGQSALNGCANMSVSRVDLAAERTRRTRPRWSTRFVRAARQRCSAIRSWRQGMASALRLCGESGVHEFGDIERNGAGGGRRTAVGGFARHPALCAWCALPVQSSACPAQPSERVSANLGARLSRPRHLARLAALALLVCTRLGRALTLLRRAASLTRRDRSLLLHRPAPR